MKKSISLCFLTCLVLAATTSSKCFALSQTYEKVTGPYNGVSSIYSVSAGDFDKDGDQDILISTSGGLNDQGTPRTRIYRNDGNFTFSIVDIPALANEIISSFADIDNDGDLDIVLSQKVLINAGAGSYLTQSVFPIGFTNTADISVADFNGDKRADILGCTFTSCVVLTQAANGTFSVSSLSLPAVGYGSDSKVADYDRDGDPDVSICGFFNNNTMSTKIFRNDGNQFADSGITLPTAYPCKSAWLDIDGDRKLDYLFTGSGQTTLNIFRYVSASSFSQLQSKTPAKVNGDIQAIDINFDDKLDLLYTGMATSTPALSFLVNQGDGSFAQVDNLINEDLSTFNGRTLVADLNNDGALDLFFVGNNSDGTMRNSMYRGRLRYSLTGVIEQSGRALTGVTMSLAGTETGTAATDTTGTYVFPAVMSGSYTVTPTQQNCTFTPKLYTFTVSNADVKRLNFAATCTTTVPASTATPTPAPTIVPVVDKTAPSVLAQAGKVSKRGRTVVRYLLTYSDENGTSETVQETLTFSRAGKLLLTAKSRSRVVASGTVIRYSLPNSATYRRAFKFCVTATDSSKNKSKRSCASMK